MELKSKEAFLFGIFLIIISRLLHFDNIVVIIGILLIVFGLFGDPFSSKEKEDTPEKF